MLEIETETELVLPYYQYMRELSADRHFRNRSWEELGIHGDLTEEEIVLLAKRLDWQVMKSFNRGMILVDTERFVRESVYHLRYRKEKLRRQIRQYDQLVNDTLRYLRKHNPRVKFVTFESLHATMSPSRLLTFVPFGLYRYDALNWYVGDAQRNPGWPRLWAWVRHVIGDGCQPYQGGMLTDPTWRVAADSLPVVVNMLIEEHTRRRGILRRATKVWQWQPPSTWIQIDRTAPRSRYGNMCPALQVSVRTGAIYCEVGAWSDDAFWGAAYCWTLIPGVWSDDIYRLAEQLECQLGALLAESGAALSGDRQVGWRTRNGDRLYQQIEDRIATWRATFERAEVYFADRIHELRLHPWMTEEAIMELALRLEDEYENKGVHVRGTEAWIRKCVGKPKTESTAG